MTKTPDCNTQLTICLTIENRETVSQFQVFIKSREKKINFNKSQTINRIIKEWAEDRQLTLEVVRREK